MMSNQFKLFLTATTREDAVADLAPKSYRCTECNEKMATLERSVLANGHGATRRPTAAVRRP